MPAPPGARLSAVDLSAITLCAAVTLWTYDFGPPLDFLAVVALGHFFLFCNVFRIRTAYELTWAAVFVLNVSWHVAAGEFSWISVLGLQTPLTVALIAAEMAGGTYHGLGWLWINPRSAHDAARMTQRGAL